MEELTTETSATRRGLLSAAGVLLTAGCLGDSDSGAELGLGNNHDAPHYLHVRVTGSENQEPVTTATAYLEPGEHRIVDEQIDLSSVEGTLQVVTRIDHQDAERNARTGGFVYLSVSIDESGSVTFTEGEQ